MTTKSARDILITNEITTFFHCAMCMAEKPPDQSPREFAQLEVGWTPLGIQVWCKRHEVNVMHMDFEGQQHRASSRRLLKPSPRGGEQLNQTDLNRRKT